MTTPGKPSTPPGRPYPCPLCGSRLRLLEDVNEQTAPYLCDEDRRAWWGSELTVDARGAFDPVTVSWRPGRGRADVEVGIRDEVAARRAKRGPQ